MKSHEQYNDMCIKSAHAYILCTNIQRCLPIPLSWSCSGVIWSEQHAAKLNGQISL